MSAADDVVDDNAGVHVALIHILTKHALAAFLLGPVDLFGAQRIAHPERHRDAAGTGTDDRNLWQLTRDISVQTELSAERHGQNLCRIVVTKRQRHLKIMRGVFAGWINKVADAKGAGSF